jgi:hypothetical protein
VNVGVLSNACFKYDQIAEKLKSVAEEIMKPWAGASPLREVQEEYVTYNINDPGSEVLELVCYVICCVVLCGLLCSVMKCYVVSMNLHE